jgi:iron complex outermembrane receptor protein
MPIFFVILFMVTVLLEAFAEDDILISGSVKKPGGIPIPRATVSVEEASITTETDEEGNYSLRLPSGTYTIIVEAEGYEVRGETFSTNDQKSLEFHFSLSPRNLAFEEIVIGAEESASGVSVSSPTSIVNPERRARSSSVLSSVTDVAGVAPLGQGGLFQVPSIRGAARERTILMLESVRVTSERRTGPSFSFVDPLLFEKISITRGPAPVLYGSNGETGLIQATTLEPTSTSAETNFHTGYFSNVDENWQALTFKNGSEKFQYSLGAARREAGTFESGDGQKFLGGYTRVNLLAKGRWFTDAGTLTFLALPAWTDDIEKASSDAAARPTLYPEERHQVYTVDWQNRLLQGLYSYQLQGWYHPSSLITEDSQLTDGALTSRNIVYNDTDDFGIRFRIGRSIGESWTLWTGVDHFGRTSVNARQESFVPTETGDLELVNSFYSIQDGSYFDTGLFLTANGKLGKAITNTGVRGQRVATENHAGPEITDSEYSWSGTFGLSYPLSENWDAIFNMGRGIRPATISEKFFTGETGRGSITGNPNLVTESNLEFDGGIRYHRGNGFAGFYVFHNDIEDFIARVRIADGSFTYFNLPEVRIYGVEGEAYYAWNAFRFYGNFHSIVGNDDQDNDINDIPPSRIVGGIEYEAFENRWNASLEIVRQFEKGDPGPDEFERDAALVINAKAEMGLWENFRIRVSGLNLTDEAYFDSADNRAPLAVGRCLGIELLAGF